MVMIEHITGMPVVNHAPRYFFLYDLQICDLRGNCGLGVNYLCPQLSVAYSITVVLASSSAAATLSVLLDTVQIFGYGAWKSSSREYQKLDRYFFETLSGRCGTGVPGVIP